MIIIHDSDDTYTPLIVSWGDFVVHARRNIVFVILMYNRFSWVMILRITLDMYQKHRGSELF